MKAMSKKLMKGNEIIKKLQGEIKNYHGKIRLGNKCKKCLLRVIALKTYLLDTLHTRKWALWQVVKKKIILSIFKMHLDKNPVSFRENFKI